MGSLIINKAGKYESSLLFLSFIVFFFMSQMFEIAMHVFIVVNIFVEQPTRASQ